MVNKRKRDELTDSDSDEATPGRQILPVANLPYNFDQEPQDGMQYLFLVRRDARRLPDVTRAPNPYEVFETKVTHTFTPSSTNVLPSEEWKIAFQTHFYNLRKNLTQTTKVDPGSKRSVIPEKKDRDAWWKFLTGHPKSAWCPKDRSVSKKPAASMRAFAHSPTDVFSVEVTSLPEQAGDESSKSPAASSVDAPENVPRQSGFVDLARSGEAAGVAPFAVGPSVSLKEVQEDRIGQLSPPQVTPSHLREIDYKMSMHLLMYFTHWINIHLQNLGDRSMAISVSHGQWIFALLTKVEDQLSADEMHLIRNLARACLGLIQEHKGDPALAGDVSSLNDTTHMSEASCWIIFAAIAGYWGQRDLWADAEAILARP